MFHIYPLGESSAVVEFGNSIDLATNRKVHAMCRALRESNPGFLLDLVPAYASLGVFYDPGKVEKQDAATCFEAVAAWIQQVELPEAEIPEGVLIEIPVCYHPSLAPDLERLARDHKMDPEEIIALHTAVTYDVYMIGFLPSFPYMGLVNEAIAFPRLATPRPNLAAGSVGIAGRQTGIYPLETPGGWNIIGRTPIKIFDSHRNQAPSFLTAGDRVRFHRIEYNEYKDLKGRDS